jgi:hypothetical protein
MNYRFPYVELSIPKESVYAKKVLSQAELEELFAKKFTNLESYVRVNYFLSTDRSKF